MNALRRTMRVVGVALIVYTMAVAGYARFGGEDVRDRFQVRSGTDYYLVASGAVAHCTAVGERIDIPPLGPREVLDGARMTPRADGRLTCEGGDVTVTSGATLALYPLAEYDFVPVIAGAALIVCARFVPRRDTD